MRILTAVFGAILIFNWLEVSSTHSKVARTMSINAQETPTPTPSPTPSPSPSPTATATPVPEPEPIPTPTATPLNLLRRINK